jgi:hypothetical protein
LHDEARIEDSDKAQFAGAMEKPPVVVGRSGLV